jgi:hypothetical protein
MKQLNKYDQAYFDIMPQQAWNCWATIQLLYLNDLEKRDLLVRREH